MAKLQGIVCKWLDRDNADHQSASQRETMARITGTFRGTKEEASDMRPGSPARLFHAIVLTGAALGASSCQSSKDAAADAKMSSSMDAGGHDRPGTSTIDAPDLALGDASSDGPRDASCDVACQHSANSCQCIIIIL